MGFSEVLDGIGQFFATAGRAVTKTTEFIISIPGYIDWNIALWAGAAGLAVFALLQLRKFFPDAGAFLGSLAVSTGTLILGMIIRKRHDDAAAAEAAIKKKRRR